MISEVKIRYFRNHRGELPTRFGRWVVRKLKLTKDEIDTVVSIDGIKCSVDARVQSLNLVSESGLYDLIMQSRFFFVIPIKHAF